MPTGVYKRKRKGEYRKCLICSKVFYVRPYQLKNNTKKYCSGKCLGNAMKSGKWIKCNNCGKLIYRHLCQLKKNKRHFCSLNCRYNAQKSYMREVGKQFYNRVEKICQFCGKKFIVVNCRKNTAKFCSKKCRGKFFIGKNASHWQGGKTSPTHLIRYCYKMKFWRLSILKRDNYTCQKCGVKSGYGHKIYLHAHHIFNFGNYPTLRFVVFNGITFCEKCHIKFHKLYGKYNNNEKQLQEFLIKP